MNKLRSVLVAAPLAVVAVGCSTNPGASPSSDGASSTVTVVITEAGCAPSPASVPSGAVTFNATNQGAAAVSELELKQGERILGERENLVPGLSSSFTVQLSPGSYILECPGATTDEFAFSVT